MRKLIFVTTILTPAAAHGGGYFIPNETSRDLALCESALADQDGAEALLINVAGLAGQKGLNISANGEILANSTEWSNPSLGEASLIVTPTFPPALAVGYGDTLSNGMAWGVAIGGSVPGGAQLKWPNGWPGQEFAQEIEQQTFVFGAGGAIQPLPWLKVGASYLRYHIVEELHQSINFLDHFGDAGVQADGGGNSFNAGIQIDVPSFPVSIAGFYRHSADVTMTGHAHFTNVPPTFQPMIHDQDVTHDTTIPNEVWVGAAWEVMPNLKAMAAVNWERWSVYKNDTIVGSDGFMVTVPRDYDDAYVIRLGGEWKNTPFLPPLTLRLGGLRSISPQPSTTISPSLTDADSWAFSLGAGYDVIQGLRVDVGYQQAFFDKVTASGMEAFPGSYDSTASLISVGVNWRTDLGLGKE